MTKPRERIFHRLDSLLAPSLRRSHAPSRPVLDQAPQIHERINVSTTPTERLIPSTRLTPISRVLPSWRSDPIDQDAYAEIAAAVREIPPFFSVT